MSRQIRQRSRERYLTPEEAEHYRQIRKRVAKEMPHILERRRAGVAINAILQELKAARETLGLSLTDVQAQTGMDRSAVSRLENGQRENPTVDTLVRYADAVGKRLVITLVDADSY